MVIVKLDGGMGNQLFQYAAGRYVAEKHGVELKLDLDSYPEDKRQQYSLNHFNIKEVFSTKKEKASLKRKEYIAGKLRKIGFSPRHFWYSEKSPGYDDNIEKLTDSIYLEGFWQSEKYFKPIEGILRKEFVVKTPPSKLNEQNRDRIRSVNAVSLHVRRGDYVSDQFTNAVHGVCGIDYYKEAVGHMVANVNNPHFFIFSDDMSWTKTNLLIEGCPAEYIDHNASADYEDLRLMHYCRHHIIANSSFSWWGAWLNNSVDKKVIAPKKWFRSVTNHDIIPAGWLTL